MKPIVLISRTPLPFVLTSATNELLVERRCSSASTLLPRPVHWGSVLRDEHHCWNTSFLNIDNLSLLLTAEGRSASSFGIFVPPLFASTLFGDVPCYRSSMADIDCPQWLLRCGRSYL